MVKKTLVEYPDLLNIEDVQEYLNCGRNFLLRELKTKNLRGFKLAKRWKIPKNEIKRYLKSKEGITE